MAPASPHGAVLNLFSRELHLVPWIQGLAFFSPDNGPGLETESMAALMGSRTDLGEHTGLAGLGAHFTVVSPRGNTVVPHSLPMQHSQIHSIWASTGLLHMETEI